MAAGNTYWFVAYLKRVFDFQSADFGATPNTIKIAFIKSLANTGFDPAVDTPWPTWGSAGTTDMSAYEVDEGGVYVAGGFACASPASTLVSNVIQLDFDNPAALAQDAGNPTNARWAIGYDDTSANKDCIFWYDLGADSDLSSGETSLAFGIPALTITVTTP